MLAEKILILYLHSTAYYIVCMTLSRESIYSSNIKPFAACSC